MSGAWIGHAEMPSGLWNLRGMQHSLLPRSCHECSAVHQEFCQSRVPSLQVDSAVRISTPRLWRLLLELFVFHAFCASAKFLDRILSPHFPSSSPIGLALPDISWRNPRRVAVPFLGAESPSTFAKQHWSQLVASVAAPHVPIPSSPLPIVSLPLLS